jgi:hypothetical protein
MVTSDDFIDRPGYSNIEANRRSLKKRGIPGRARAAETMAGVFAPIFTPSLLPQVGAPATMWNAHL